MKFLCLILACLPVIALADITIPPGPIHCHVARDENGKIARNHSALVAFAKANPCPATGKRETHCPGYVIDHRRPLCGCGKDEPANMQWQAKAESKLKDKKEVALCNSLWKKGWVK